MELTLSTCINRAGRSHRKNRANVFVMLLALFVFPCFKNITAQVNVCNDDIIFNLESLNFPANLWRIEDVLNVGVDNTTSEDLQIYLYAIVMENNYGDLFEITSDDFIIPPGFTNYINAPDLEPIDVNNLNEDFSEFAQKIAMQTGSLPFGAYQICVFAKDASSDICYGTGCINQIVAHPSPPEPIMPVDESIVIEDLPLFSWLPPMPYYDEITYTIEIVEILDGQTPQEAMDANFKWFTDSGLEIFSFLYPVSERGFIPGARYAWRVEAIMFMGNQNQTNPIIMSPIRTFTFRGTGQDPFSQPYLVELKSPGNDSIQENIPFFEWELTVSSAQTTSQMAEEEDIYYDFRIWKWHDSMAGSYAGSNLDFQANDLQYAPYYEANKLETNYYDIMGKAPDTLNNNCTYFWKVTCIKDEKVIAESVVGTFTLLSDTRFMDAARSMLGAVQLGDHFQIYGLIQPVEAGEVIKPEVTSDRDSIEVISLSYLFIVDDEPYSRFGHPVRYVLVDAETGSPKVYNANWFPTLKNADSAWSSPGNVKVNEIDIALLSSGRGATQTSAPRGNAGDIELAVKDIECGKYILLIDGGDNNRTRSTSNNAAHFSRDTDSIQALYEKSGYKSLRFSQYWGQKNKNIKAIPVDSAGSGVEFIEKMVSGIKKHYISKECCKSSKLEFRLVIYINANAIESSSKFMLYHQDGSGKFEEIGYFENILKHLQTLPQCVRITLFVDACFSGILADTKLLDTYLKRGNYEIITAADAHKTTPSGAKPSVAVTKVKKDNKSGGLMGSYSQLMALSVKNAKPGQVKIEINEPGKNIEKINELAREIALESNRVFANPQYARILARDEYTLQFPAVKNQAKLKEGKVSPPGSANILADLMSGEVIVFPKIKGEITVTVSYENGLEEQKPVTSKWGDETRH